jgi:eukaryotic-like serine/threonine-protein kinase
MVKLLHNVGGAYSSQWRFSSGASFLKKSSILFLTTLALSISIARGIGAFQSPVFASAQRQMAFVDLNGNVKNLRFVPASIFGPRISPSARQVAYRDGDAVWIADLTSNAAPRRLTTEPGEGPIWSPDGERIVYISIYKGMEALFSRHSDGSGSPELLVDRARAPESWSAVNQAFSFITLVGPSGDAGDYDIWTYSLQTKKATPLIVIPPSAQSGSRFSPDGKWMAYESNESGRAEIYVETYPRSGKRFQITKTGGSRPLWAPDSSRLYYDNNSPNATQLFYVNTRLQPEFTFSGAQALPIKGFVQPSGTIRRQYDITPDGQQFLVTLPPVTLQPRN